MSDSRLASPSAWKGIWTALITPLKADLGLDVPSLEKLMNAQIAGGVTGLVIAGSTGEGSLLPEATYAELLKAARKIAGTRVPLVAGLGIGGTTSSVKAGKIAKDCGYDGLLASPPAYVKGPQRGLKKHFLQIAEIGLPVCLYEIPGRAASSLHVQTLVELVTDHGPLSKLFVATKDATGDLGRMIDSKAALGEKIAFLSGDDLSFHGYLCHGGDGVISVVSHFVPKTLRKMMEHVDHGKVEDSLQLQQRIQKFTASLFSESNPIPVKSLLAKNGAIASAHFNGPLLPMDEKLLAKCSELYDGLKGLQ